MRTVPQQTRRQGRFGVVGLFVALALIALALLVILLVGGPVLLIYGCYLAVLTRRSGRGSALARPFGLRPSYGLATVCVVTGLAMSVGGVAWVSHMGQPSTTKEATRAAPAHSPVTPYQAPSRPSIGAPEPPLITTNAPTQPAPDVRGGAPQNSDSSLCGDAYYRNSDGDCVHRPDYAPAPPADATAHCRDGAYSFSKHRRGTCSGHGGVAEWL